MLRESLLGLFLSVSLLNSTPSLARELPDFTQILEKYSPAVVSVIANMAGDNVNEVSKKPATPPREGDTRNISAGFIWNAEGYVITSAASLDNSERIMVRLADKREFRAKLLGMDKRTDIALLKIETNNLPVVSIGETSKLKQGEWILTVGSPMGFEQSVTAGIVSYKERVLPQDSFISFLQTNLLLNQGNTGGPVFNLNGEVVAMNSLIYSSGAGMGVSFSVPIEMVMQIAEQLRSTGRVVRGRVGVAVQEMTREIAESVALTRVEGAFVKGVEKGGPADKGGLEDNDVILKVNGKAIPHVQDFQRMIAASKPNSKVELEVWRKGELKKLTVQVMEASDEPKLSKRKPTPEESGNFVARLGIGFIELGKDRAHELQLQGGLFIEEVRGSTARTLGLRQGDILLAVNNKPVRNLTQLNEVLKSIPSGKNAALLIRRGETTSYVALRLDEK